MDDTTILIIAGIILFILLALLTYSRLFVGRNEPTFNNTYTHNGDIHEHFLDK